MALHRDRISAAKQSMTYNYVVLTYEIFKREAESLSHLAECLAAKGYLVILVHQSLAYSALRFLPPSICLLKSIDYGKRHDIGRLNARGHVVFCLEAESILINPHFFPRTRIDAESLQKVRRYFTSGRYQRELCEQGFVGHQERFLDVGSLQADRQNDSRRESPTAGPSEGGILFCTGFGFFNHFLGAGKQRDMFRGYLDPAIQESLSSKIDAYMTQAAMNFTDFVTLLCRLAMCFPKVQITVRVHPSESSAIWEDLARLFPNVRIDSHSPIADQITEHGLIVCHPSTLAFQAHLYRRPCFVFESDQVDIDDSNYPHHHPHQLASRLFRSIPMLIAEVGSALASGYQRTPQQAELLEYLCTGCITPGYSTASRIAEDFAKVCGEPEPSTLRVHIAAAAYRAFWILFTPVSAILMFAKALVIHRTFKYGRMKMAGALQALDPEVAGTVSRMRANFLLTNLYVFASRSVKRRVGGTHFYADRRGDNK
jgi:surface carbohydrate biosynthesis protein